MRKNIPGRRALLLKAAAAAAAAHWPVTPALAADAWPERSITYIVPFTPGGATDILGRLYSQALAQSLKVPVVVENIGGTGGSLGSAKAARAKPDGYTLVGGTISSHAINVSIYPSVGYDPVKSFEPVILSGTLPNVMLVRADGPFKTLDDVIAAGKKPGSRISYGSAGVGSSQHLTGSLFALETGTELLHVPYKGSGPALQALMSGEIDLLFDNITPGIPFVNAGRLRALGVTSLQESRSLPGVKPLAQQGLAGFEVLSWQAVFAPAGTPAPIIDKLHRHMAATLKQPEVQEKLAALGLDVSGAGPQALRALQRREVAKWAEVARRAQVKLD
ncbi:tripartite tricarboxylate transporter substrate binding protein [Comamonas antarctica]|uniref:Bug family tripartite tricarboxylate transporter substrate binding protein n=1 Tax=Comamonas antarctica TaxID=2743470 RepID=UPI0028F13D5E|nr:tripartite tricarboxylate transporter substrate binding protein [Comamonas antarctica]